MRLYQDTSWGGGRLALGDSTHIIYILSGHVGCGYEVNDCNTDWCKLADRAFCCGRTSQDITLMLSIFRAVGSQGKL